MDENFYLSLYYKSPRILLSDIAASPDGPALLNVNYQGICLHYLVSIIVTSSLLTRKKLEVDPSNAYDTYSIGCAYFLMII
jgi:hypothetical protein